MLISLIYLVAICAGAALVYWAVDKLQTPEPINRIVKVATVVIATLIIIMIILRLFGVAAFDLSHIPG